MTSGLTLLGEIVQSEVNRATISVHKVRFEA